MPQFGSDNPEDFYRTLRDKLSAYCRKTGQPMPAGDKLPSRQPKGPNMDVHLADFLGFIQKYAGRLKLEWEVYETGNDLVLKIEGWHPRESSLSRKSDIFLFKLRTQSFRFGVPRQTIKSFRDIFELTNDTEFFQGP
jgi:hypothetical protein